MTNDQAVAALGHACQVAHRYLMELALAGRAHSREREDGKSDWAEAQQALFEALRVAGVPRLKARDCAFFDIPSPAGERP